VIFICTSRQWAHMIYVMSRFLQLHWKQSPQMVHEGIHRMILFVTNISMSKNAIPQILSQSYQKLLFEIYFCIWWKDYLVTPHPCKVVFYDFETPLSLSLFKSWNKVSYALEYSSFILEEKQLLTYRHPIGFCRGHICGRHSSVKKSLAIQFSTMLQKGSSRLWISWSSSSLFSTFALSVLSIS